MNSNRIYLDYAATTREREEVANVVRETSFQYPFNPSSLHSEGRRARAALDDARDRIAALIAAKRTEIVFTSSGTEANNLALLGVVRGAPRASHVIASAIEHHSVLGALELLKDLGVETTLLPVDRQGLVDPAEFERALRPGTVLASVMYANNEVGTIQPIAALARIARARGVLFHTDAVAAPTWLAIDVRALGVDMLSIAGHKLYGPKGVGLLYVREGVPLGPSIVGGGHESGRRSGTENLPGIAGLARALELAALERSRAAVSAARLRNRLEAGVRAAVPGVTVNAAQAPRLPNLSNLSFEGTDPAAMLIALDLAGIAASAGSACTSGTLEPSHVLAAMAGEGVHPSAGIRFSLGVDTTADEIERVIAVLVDLVPGLRASPGSIPFAGGMDRIETNRAPLEAEG